MIANPSFLNSTIEIGGTKFSRKSDETFLHTLSEYQTYYDATIEDRRREDENIGFLYGLENKQWPSEAIEQLQHEGRHIGTYNLSYRKVAGIAGSISRNPFDAKYIGDDPKQDWLTEMLQQMYLSDKELMDWEAEYLQALLYGLTYRSVLEMRVETEAPASPLGNIAIRNRLPGTVMLDPDWKTTSSKHLDNAYVLSYLTAKQIKEIYHKKTDEIESEIQMSELFGKKFETNQGVLWNQGNPLTMGSRYLVIEKRFIEREKVTRSYDPVTKTVFWEWMTEDEKVDLAQRLEISSEDIKDFEVQAKVSKTRTICPSISTNLVLEDEKDTFQIGRLNLFPWSATWVNGKSLGIIDFLKDAQREINYRQSTITLAAQSAINSGVIVDPAAFGNDEGLINEFKKDFGNPRQVAMSKAGMSRQFPDAVKPLARIQVAPDLFNIVNQMIDLMDILVPQPAAGEARTERSGESGIHMAQKLEVMKTMQTPIMAGIRQLWNDLAESYLYLASQLYSHGMRRFTSADGKTEFDVNVPSVDSASGQEVIENDFSKVASVRHRIQISESPSGINVRLIQRELNLGILSTWPKEMLPNSAVTYAENVQRSMDLTETEKANAQKAIDLDRTLVESRTMAEIAQNQVVINQAQQQQEKQQQEKQQPGQPAPQGQGGQINIPGAQAPEPAIAQSPQPGV